MKSSLMKKLLGLFCLLEQEQNNLRADSTLIDCPVLGDGLEGSRCQDDLIFMCFYSSMASAFAYLGEKLDQRLLNR